MTKRHNIWSHFRLAALLAVLVLANVVFVVYDLALEGLIVQYLNRVHDRLGKLLRGK